MPLTEFYDISLRQFQNCVTGYYERVKNERRRNAELALMVSATVWSKKPLTVEKLTGEKGANRLTEDPEKLKEKLKKGKEWFDDYNKRMGNDFLIA